MKILIIEDQEDIRATLRDLLEINGHEVVEAADGVQGVQQVAQKPDFIFCDLAMPKLDGHGVLAAVKQLPEIRDVPFVFLTARAERHDQREGMALGADDYITKPFSERDILDAIAARSQRRRSLHDRIQELARYHRSEINAQWSHELLTPLNAVMGMVGMLESEAETIPPGELKEMLAIIRAGAERQEKLARKLILYFRLEQMSLSPMSDRGSSEASRVVLTAAAQAARDRNREADLATSAESGQVAIDDELLRTALYEVVDNALGFSKPGQPVRVMGTVRAGHYRIDVIDEGPGMTAEQCANVGAFTQFDRRKREQQGLGLGLAIARSTAKLAGGHLHLTPLAADRGLAVTFDLPCAAGVPGP